MRTFAHSECNGPAVQECCATVIDGRRQQQQPVTSRRQTRFVDSSMFWRRLFHDSALYSIECDREGVRECVGQLRSINHCATHRSSRQPALRSCLQLQDRAGVCFYSGFLLLCIVSSAQLNAEDIFIVDHIIADAVVEADGRWCATVRTAAC